MRLWPTAQWLSALCLWLCWVPCAVQAQISGAFRIEGFDESWYSPFYIDEDSGTVTVNVLRQGEFAFPSSVRYRVTSTSPGLGDGSATAGLDFLPVEGRLDFGPSETNKTFSFTVLADNLFEGDEDLQLRIGLEEENK